VSGRVTAAVIGAGAMGARLDRPGTSEPLTHAGGYVAAGFDLVALVDPNDDARAAAKQWGSATYDDLDRLLRAGLPDVVSVVTPAAVRGALLHKLLALQPRVVVAEKPLTTSVAETEKIVAAYRARKVPLLVNYSRRFVPFWESLRGSAAMSTSIRYAKGIRHNGTHAIDLCRMLFGECVGAQPLSRRSDFWPEDPTISAFLAFERCPEVFLHGLDERAFTLFEVDIIAPTWRVIVDSDGRRARRFELREDTGFPPGRRLIETQTAESGASRAMLNLMRNVRAVLDGALPLCSGEDALAAQRIANRLAA
jgi:predicted dehydrogenase